MTMAVFASQTASKTNVLLLLNSFETGGAEGQLVLLARLLTDSGRYHVHLACLSRTGPLLAEAEKLVDEEIAEFPLNSFYDGNMARQLRKFRTFLRERKIDVVHTDGFYTNIFGVIGAKLAGVPARIGFRGETQTDGRTSAQNLVERSAFRFASVVHANSEAVKNFLVEQGVPARNIAVVYNGLDFARVMPPADLTRNTALELFDLPRERRFVTMVANLHNPVKDYPMFLRAAASVRAKVSDAAFVVAGEGEMLEDLRALARDLRIERDVFFIGRCNRVAELLFASDVCVLSSKAEGFSNAILEYMGAARPVVATDVGGAREAIVEGESGYLVASGDHETMATRITELLQNSQKGKAMGERGRGIVQQKFSSEVQLQRTAELYEKFLSKSLSSSVSVPGAVATGW
ncbi:MAG TPA: glycosyltransferase [Pyrinomonadaceae bacterium]|nr:glycosyltransferase [Pyrinomonadaceae bacterium]